MAEHRYQIVITPLAKAEGGGYLAVVPELPGCMSDGESREAALANADDAVSAWIEAQKAAGRPVPKPDRHLRPESSF